MLNKIKNIKLSSIFLSIFLGLFISQANAAKILHQEEFYRIYQMEKQDLNNNAFLRDGMMHLVYEITPTKNAIFCSDLVDKKIRSINPEDDVFLIAQNKKLEYIGWIIFKKINENVYSIQSKAAIGINIFDLGKNLLLSITKIPNLPEKFKIITEYAPQEKKYFESLGFKNDPKYSQDTNRASLIAFNQSIIQNNLNLFKEFYKLLTKKLNEELNYEKYSHEPSIIKTRERTNKEFFIQEIAPYIPEIEVLRNKILEIKKYCTSKPLLKELYILEIYINECSDLISKLIQINFTKKSRIRIIQ